MASKSRRRVSKNSDLDISLMDTEPLNANEDSSGSESEIDVEQNENGSNNASTSMLNTEPMENDDVEVESSCSEDDWNLKEKDSDSDLEMLSDCSPSRSEITWNSAPPAVDITLAPSHEVKRIYSELIESCRGFEDIINNDSEKILKENIITGDALNKQMETTLSQSMNETLSNSQKNSALGNSVGETYLACLHTRMCSSMLKYRVKNITGVSSKFKLDDFLNRLRDASVDEEGGYSVLMAVRNLAFTFASIGKSAPILETLYGAVDKERFSVVEDAPLKETKVRASRKIENTDNTTCNETQKEIINRTTQGSTPSLQKDAPQALARDVLKTVKARYHEGGEVPQKLLDVARTDNLPDFLSRVFGVAFLVRDGYIGVSQSMTNETQENADLVLKPEKPPTNKPTENENHRRQTIVSFSSLFLKDYLNSSD